jgi:hypothetical protein
MSKKMTQRLYYYFALFMAILMVASLILPSIAQNVTQSQQQAAALTPIPTNTAVPPTFPAPLTDLTSITFDEDYLHPSGLFYVNIPTGWSVSNNVNNSRQAQVSFNSPTTSSVIELYVERPSTPVTTPEEVSGLYTSGVLAGSWNRYDSWREAGERRYVDDRVIIDFVLSRQGQDYFAQHTAWTDGNLVYVVRVVTPSNARDLMFWLSETMPTKFHVFEQYKTTPLGWTGNYNQFTTTFIRYPSTWRILDGGVGKPITAGAEDGTGVIVTTQEGQIADEAAAREFVSGLRRNIEIVSVKDVTRTGASGFSVAYKYFTPDGEERNGLAVLLNGENNQLHTAVGQIPSGGVDLNSDAGRAQFFDFTTALDTFSLLTGLNLPELEQPAPVPTAIPTTAVPTTEATPEMTVEVTNEATQEAVVETTPELTAEATPSN